MYSYACRFHDFYFPPDKGRRAPSSSQPTQQKADRDTFHNNKLRIRWRLDGNWETIKRRPYCVALEPSFWDSFSGLHTTLLDVVRPPRPRGAPQQRHRNSFFHCCTNYIATEEPFLWRTGKVRSCTAARPRTTISLERKEKYQEKQQQQQRYHHHLERLGK